jgi:hypothetical protein
MWRWKIHVLAWNWYKFGVNFRIILANNIQMYTKIQTESKARAFKSWSVHQLSKSNKNKGPQTFYDS